MRKIFTAFFFSLLSLSVAAQEDEKDEGGRMMLIGGYNLSDVKMSGTSWDAAGAGDAGGFYVGVMYDRKIIPLLYLQSGLKYVKNGFESGDNRIVLNYVQLPIAAKVKLGPVFATGGIYAGYRAGSKVNHGDGSETKLTTDDIGRWDYGANLGLGVQLGRLGVEARYNWGFADISKDGGEINNRFLELGGFIVIK